MIFFAEAIVCVSVDAIKRAGQFLTIDAGFLPSKPLQSSR
jgi:hypothetical protein